MKDGIKDVVLMFLANAIYTETITEDQAINSLKAMDESSQGTSEELDKRAKALTPVLTDLTMNYVKESKL